MHDPLHMAEDPMVLCAGITKSFGHGENQVMALRGIDLTVHRGELLMLVGPSGCGKTTLISVMAAMLRPDSGTCTVMGHDLAQMSDRTATEFRGKHIGFIFQAYNLLPSLTITENVAIPLIVAGRPYQEANRRAAEILGEVGLGKRLESRPSQLSGGQQQRVAIARALVHEPQLLVCDEPTSALDHHTGAHVMELIRHAAKDRQATPVIITHDNRILDYADRIAHMDDGRIIDDYATLQPPLTEKVPA